MHGEVIARQYTALRQKITDAYFIRLTCFTGPLGDSWAASPFRAHGLFSFSVWLAALAEAAVLLLACHLLTRQYEQGVLFRLGRVRGPRDPGFRAGTLRLPRSVGLRVILIGSSPGC